MPFLFRTYHGKVVRNEGIAFPPGFDYAILTLALPELVFRFVRGRGELNVVVAPAFARGDWHELALVLSALDANEHLERGSCETLWDVSLALEPRIDGVIRLFSPANFDSLKMRLHDDVYAQDEINRRVWENELSRKFNS